MSYTKSCCVASAAIVPLLTLAAAVGGADREKKFEKFDAGNFGRSDTIDNQWLPLRPGMRYIWDGMNVDEEGEEEAHSVVLTVTDLTKVIDGVRTVVCWERDIVDGELEETEIFFAAQDNDGTVWLLGEYPEEYDGGELDAAPCWIHGIQAAQAGIMMLAEPLIGSPSYSQGWAPAVDFSDRGAVYQTGKKTRAPVGSYEDVLVIDEYNDEEPGAYQLKYYARGVGNVRVGWRGEVTDQETLELVQVNELSVEELAAAREKALKLERHAYEISKDVYGRTEPSKLIASNGEGQDARQQLADPTSVEPTRRTSTGRCPDRLFGIRVSGPKRGTTCTEPLKWQRLF